MVAILKLQIELERIPFIDIPSVYIIIDLNRVQFSHLLKWYGVDSNTREGKTF